MDATRETTKRTEILLALDWEVPLESRYRLARHAEALEDRTVAVDELAGRAAVPTGHVAQTRELLRSGSARVDATRRRAEETGARLVPYSSDQYPRGLRELDLPPPCLFVRGSFAEGPFTSERAALAVLDRPALGIVGPRNADPYGLEVTRHLAGELSRAGLVIGSGFARGVDAAAHREAAENGNPTVAWLGCGVDVPYPRQNQRLVEPILETGGLLVSEFDFGITPAAWRFPLRNRLIAASTIGMLVTQASLRSGSLISARLALEMGREVYAVPGRIFDARSKGTNLLLRDGAHVVLGPSSILDTMPLHVQEKLARLRRESSPGSELVDRLRRALRSAERVWTADELGQELGLGDTAALLAALSELELDGSITRNAGGGFRSRRKQ